MLVYEKTVVVNNTQERHLYGTMGNIPTVNDNSLIYRNSNGGAITPTLNDTYLDDGHGGIIQKSTNEAVTVFIDNTNIIPGASFKVKPVAIVADVTGMTTSYNVNEQLNTAGLVVNASYTDGTSSSTNEYTTSPANGAALNTAGNVTVNVSGVNAFNGLTTNFKVTVTE